MSTEPPSKKSRREQSASWSSDRLTSAKGGDAQPSTSATNPYQGNCRAYGGSDHLPLDLESHGFQLLDEANNDDDDNGESEVRPSIGEGDGQYTDSDNDSSLSSDRVSQEEIHALLEEGVTAALGSNKQPLDKQAKAKETTKGDLTSANPKVIQKFLVADLDNLFNHFERLPEGWAQITHNSGLPVYLHRPTRVCTFGRPYFLGDGSVRKHDVPLSAVPCLHYRRIKGELEVQQSIPEPITESQPVGGVAAPEGKASELPTASATSSKTAAGAPSPAVEVIEPAEISHGVANFSCPFSGAKANGACSVGNANLTESSSHDVSVARSGKPELENNVSDERRAPNESAASAIETDVPSKEMSDSNSALTIKDNLGTVIPCISVESVANDHLGDGIQAVIPSIFVESAGKTAVAKSLHAVTNGTSDARIESNVMNGPTASESNPASNVKEGNSNVSSPKPSSTFNTALAAALNICPSQPPPKGAPPGSEEVQLEPLKLQTIDPDNLRQYCSSRFRFQTVQKMRFNSWSERRNYIKEQRRKNRPPVPEGTKLLSLKTRTYSVDDPRSHKKRNWVLNPKGKSYICILHEYVQHVLKGQPAYVFKEVENASSPYAAAIFVNGFEYATGYGSSKRQAKCEAGRATLEILMPELVREIEENEGKKNKESDLEFFDSLRIEDPNVNELCSKMSELPPYSLLLNCIQRNYCLKSDSVKCHLITNTNQKNEFVMTVGKHTVQVPCKNKKEGKQKASQALLQKLHPHINSWGSMVRLYGNRSLELLKDKKKVEQEVTLLQNNATVNQPNYSILNLLRAEMLKLHQHKESVQPMGVFRPPEDIRLPAPSSSDLNTVDL